MAEDIVRLSRRSASICAPSSSSMEAIATATAPTNARVTFDNGTPTARRRKAAARSQSARIATGRSVRRKVTTSHADIKHHSNSEPKLTDDGTDVSPTIRRKNSRRSSSVYHRKSTAFLEIPGQRCSAERAKEEKEDEDSYRLRSFSFTSKGIINRGDSFRRRRSRSNSLLPPGSGNAVSSTKQESTNVPLKCVPTDVQTYTVALLGAHGVGKAALISQFMTSECINAYDRPKESSDAQSVFIMLNGEESELKFIKVEQFKDIDRYNLPHAYLVMYSVVDKPSYLRAETELSKLMEADILRVRPAIIVGNKVDLARSKTISSQDGKCLACTYRVKFIEISVGINHNVDELLVGVLNQIRLKSIHCSHIAAKEHSHSPWFKNRNVVKANMKARQMFTWLFGKEDSKFKNCENLQIL